MSGLKECVFGNESLYTFPFQKLHGSPVDLSAVLRLAEGSEFFLDVLQPQICGKIKRGTVELKREDFAKKKKKIAVCSQKLTEFECL